MNLEEIKRQYSMREIVERYGFQPNRAGFISCPFHKGDNTASMKIYRDSFHCFACNINGDIFSFVQGMENCDFKTAFYALGGTYRKPTSASQIALYHVQKAREKRIKKEQRLKEKMDLNNLLLGVYVVWLKKLEPFSDAWCDCMDAYTKCLHIDEELQKRERGVKQL